MTLQDASNMVATLEQKIIQALGGTERAVAMLLAYENALTVVIKESAGK